MIISNKLWDRTDKEFLGKLEIKQGEFSSIKKTIWDTSNELRAIRLWLPLIDLVALLNGEIAHNHELLRSKDVKHVHSPFNHQIFDG